MGALMTAFFLPISVIRPLFSCALSANQLILMLYVYFPRSLMAGHSSPALICRCHSNTLVQVGSRLPFGHAKIDINPATQYIGFRASGMFPIEARAAGKGDSLGKVRNAERGHA